MSNRDIYVFLVSWNRPQYLWCCLDSFYRHTRRPSKFVIADNGSTDPGVRDVIQAFVRRDLFHAVHLYEDNDPNRFYLLLDQYRQQLGEYFVWAETDVVVSGGDCWLAQFESLMNSRPKCAMLGSLIEPGDFVSIETAKRLFPDLDEAAVRHIAKADSPERLLDADYDEPVIDPFNPPGRLQICRTEPMSNLRGSDSELYEAVKKRGYTAGIATQVRHRHLSLLHAFDYVDYDVLARDRFVYGAHLRL
jgi:hypothetical protein